MRILYLTPAWYGFREMLYEGAIEIQGLPSFLFPLKALIEQGHKVEMIILHTEVSPPLLNIKSSWLRLCKVRAFVFYDLRLPAKILSIIRFRKMVSDLLLIEEYDLVYAHGTSTAVVRSVVRHRGIPFAQRLYGTFLWEKIERNGLFLTCFKHIVEFLSFATSKDFLLVTDDGSRGDLVVRRLFGDKPLPYNFYYLVNGVNRVDIDQVDLIRFEREKILRPFIFYCARFDGWKRQDRVLKILRELKSRGKIVDVYFAGPFDTLGDAWHQQIVQMTIDLEIVEQVYFLGSISRKEIFAYNRLAMASLSLYDVCNLTNVFHEMLSDGALVIVKDEEVIRKYIVDGQNGFIVKDDLEVVNLLERIFSNKSDLVFSAIRENVVNTSLTLEKDWPERVAEEIDIISKHARRAIQ